MIPRTNSLLISLNPLLALIALPASLVAGYAAAQTENMPTSIRTSAGSVTMDAQAKRAAEDFFEHRIRPLLVEHCYECHSVAAGEASGGLRLDDASAIRKGGLSGPAIVAGDAARSLLIRAVEYEETGLQMPPEGKLDTLQIQALRDWISTGAYDPRESVHQSSGVDDVVNDPSSHWAFQTPKFAPHSLSPHASSLDVLDAVVATGLKGRSLEPAPRAERGDLLRRLAYDLTGLPPSREVASVFLNDDGPLAYERLVDRLMTTPEFGERWARHWMDVARYADTVGYALGGKERRLRGSERYRDWLIDNFNGDLPYDDMIRMQLAADVFDPAGKQGHLDAMGYLTVGRRFLNELDVLDDQIDVVSRGMLGLTVTCARCHDHKFDPIPTVDYYSWFGIFNSSKRDDAEDSPWPLRMLDKDRVGDAVVLIRGQQGNRGPRAPRAFLTILENGQPKPFTEGSGRKELAERIADENNPLTARVFVNRVWQHLIGRPLVDTPSDFGVRTEKPVHPELLDDLAADFMRHQWSIKFLVRRIVLTHIYQQTSQADPPLLETDPENRLLARGNRERLDFEAMRDSCLLVSGRLQRASGGQPVDILAEPTPTRRTVYAFIDRQQLPGVFRVFDLASPDAHTPERFFTTVPQQALFLLNSPFMMQAACDLVRASEQDISKRKSTNGSVTDEALIETMFNLVLQRSPSSSELRAALEFIALPSKAPEFRTDPKQQWHYGVGRLNDDGQIHQFLPFPSFVNERYQGSDMFPDPTWSYSSLSANGGHPGPGKDWAVVRRLHIDRDGNARIGGFLKHSSDKGDGVRLTIFVDGVRQHTVTSRNDRQPLKGIAVAVKQDQTIDFIVDDNGSTSFDTFECRFSISVTGTDGDKIRFNSDSDFRGVVGPEKSIDPLNRRQQLAQVLLMSNEFIFVD